MLIAYVIVFESYCKFYFLYFPNVLKIYFSDILKKKEQVIISNIINMTHQLDITTLCEGVETLQQSEFLKSVGCDIQQGFYFSRPVTGEQIAKML